MSHSSSLPGLSSHRFFLRIAGLVIDVLSDDRELRLRVEGAGNSFLVSPTDSDIKVLARWGDLSSERRGEKIFDSGALWQVYSENTSYQFYFTSTTLGPVPYKIARFDREFTSGEVYLHHPYFTRSQPLYPLEYPLDELLVINLLATGKGAEVHACGVKDSEGDGHLFIGQSGAGKTTLARLWENSPGITVLSDDRIILRREGPSLWMYGTPWHGEAELASSDRTLLKRVYFLSKGIKNELIPLRATDAAGRLFACSFPPFYSQQRLDRTLTFLVEVAETVPCYELRFLPDEKVLELIRPKGSLD